MELATYGERNSVVICQAEASRSGNRAPRRPRLWREAFHGVEALGLGIDTAQHIDPASWNIHGHPLRVGGDQVMHLPKCISLPLAMMTAGDSFIKSYFMC